MSGPVPEVRVRAANRAQVRQDGDYVLYWMVAFRRPRHNFALDRAVALCQKLGRPLLVYEPICCDYPWASDRLHAFMLQGMADNAKAFARAKIAYFAHVEGKKGEADGLLEALAENACAVVTDDYPGFFLPQLVAKMAPKLRIRLELVDSNGLLPLRATDSTFATAYAFRIFLQKQLPHHLIAMPRTTLPQVAVVQGARVPDHVQRRWKPASDALLAATPAALSALPIDHGVGIAEVKGGHIAAGQQLTRFIEERLARYLTERNHPDKEAASELSPYLHFGHVSVHDVFARLATQSGWTLGQQSGHARGAREGFWNMGAAAEAFLDEIVTWREIGYNMAAHRPDDYDKYDALPDWAKQTLAEHAHDARDELYSKEQLEHAQTKDPLWNAAQNQIVRHGRLHNYMRMLWGKKVIQWTKTPQQAAEILIDLNNKYGVDGRDPNSYSGIFWCFGRFDRPWFKRPIFGTVRYMTSASTAKKYNVKAYLKKYG